MSSHHTSAADIVFHAGDFRPYAEAAFGIEERGVHFADGVYEVIRFDYGKPFRVEDHLTRLFTGLAELKFADIPRQHVTRVVEGLIERNGLAHGKVYLQVTRGPLTRSFAIDDAGAPVVSALAYAGSELRRDRQLPVGRAVVVEDTRWMRCDIKSLLLLPASLAKTHARSLGAHEAIFERAKPGTTEQHITEGASSNVFIVKNSELITPPSDRWILSGVTRATVIELAKRAGIGVHERCFGRQELLDADESFICSTTDFVALSQIDENVIGGPTPGPVTARLHELLVEAMISRTR